MDCGLWSPSINSPCYIRRCVLWWGHALGARWHIINNYCCIDGISCANRILFERRRWRRGGKEKIWNKINKTKMASDEPTVDFTVSPICTCAAHWLVLRRRPERIWLNKYIYWNRYPMSGLNSDANIKSFAECSEHELWCFGCNGTPAQTHISPDDAKAFRIQSNE